MIETSNPLPADIRATLTAEWPQVYAAFLAGYRPEHR
jgi:hypothetical protein